MDRFSHHRIFKDAFSSRKLSSCINSLWINDNASRIKSLHCLHCFMLFLFPSIIKIIIKKSNLTDRKRSCFKLLNQNVGRGMLLKWDDDIDYIQWWLIFEKRWERKKKMILTRTKKGGKEESMSDCLIWWWNNVRIWFIIWVVIWQWNERRWR